MGRIADNCFFPLDSIKVLTASLREECERGNFHVHSYWEIKIFADDGGSRFPVIMIVPPDIAHAITWDMFSRKRNFTLAFRQPKCLLQIFDREQGEQDLFFEFSSLDNLCPGGTAAFLDKLRFLRVSGIRAKNLEALFNHLLGTLFTAVEIALETDKGIGFSLVERACDLIERQYYEGDLTVNKIAAYLKMTPGHLANLFKKETRGTVRQYLISVRLKHAMRLLKTGAYTVKDAARMTGWNNQFYFSNSFRKRYKLSPSAVPPDADTKIVN
ncbi:MAG: helix-turn-helix transcriptional regulator [Victivallales bacterium]|nr:helix-turn-helix transcriptional regulator [Victivallales bacterium]